MASNSILKLQVDDKQYEASLKSAQQGLQALMNELRNSGKSFSDLDKNTEQYVRALGNMEATAKTTRGRIGEMSSAFVELSQVEKQLTDQERQSPVGKALAASLDQLKTRIQEGKSQLDDINKSINGGGGLTGALDSLSDKFGMSIKSLAGWGTALAAGKAALDVAKDAFFASEETVDEWGRVMDSSKSLYEGFLTSLNTGDISGFLSRIDSIVQAARAAYNELDRLGTMKTIQAPQMSAQQTENERMRMMIQTGRYIAPVDGRRASMQNGQLLTPDQIKRIEQQLQGGMQKVVTLVGNEVTQTGRAIDAVYNRQAQELGLSLKEFRKGTSSMAEFDKRMAGYDQYQKWRAAHTTIDQQSGREIVARGNPFAQYAKWGTFRVDGDRYNKLVQLIQQRDQQAGQAYSMQSQAFRTMNRAEGMTVSKIMRGETAGTSGGGSRTGGKNTPKVEEIFPEGSMKDLQRDMQELKKAQDLVTSPEEWQQLQTQIDGVTEKMNALKGVTKEVPMATGFSGLNTEAIGAYQSMLQSAMKSMDFGSEELAQTFANSIDATTLGNLLTATFKEGIDITKMQLADGSTIEDLWNKILGGENIPDSTWESLQTVINEKLAEMGIDPIKLDFKTGEVKQISNDAKEMTKDWNSAASAIQSVGQAMSQIEDPAAKVMGTVGQAIAQIALGFAQATAADSKLGVFGWIAAVTGGLGTMISTISAIHSATGYAEGGIVKGNQYSGDNIWTGNAWVNSGELILNRAQQGVLADALSEPPSSIQGGNPYVSGENIFLGINNYLRRAGYGELVTTKR